jgi:hypothetical protein
LDSIILSHHFLKIGNMELSIDFGSSWKGGFVSYKINTLDDLVGSIKLRCQFMMYLIFERCFLVMLEREKHLLIFLKNPFCTMLVSLLLHAIFGHLEVILQSCDSGCTTLQNCINRLDLGCARKTCNDCRWPLAIHCFIWGHFSGRMIRNIVPPLCQGKPLYPLMLFV